MATQDQSPVRIRPRFDAETLARAARRTPKPLLRAAVSPPFRRAMIAGIFRQMPRQLKASAAKADAVVRWDIEGTNGASDTWFLILEDGRCRTTRRAPDENPRTTFTVDAYDFICLAAGAENPMAMFQSGRIKISGDLFFAAQLQSAFAIPS